MKSATTPRGWSGNDSNGFPHNCRMTQYDVIVIGLGAMGSATLCHLARRGRQVLGLEQFGPGHRLGSSHGDSRRSISRAVLQEPALRASRSARDELWRELEDQSERRLMTITGGLMIGPREGTVVSGTLRSATTWNLPHELLDAREVHARFPTFSLREDLVAVLDPRAGFVDPERCNVAHIDLARRMARKSGSMNQSSIGLWKAAPCECRRLRAPISPIAC